MSCAAVATSPSLAACHSPSLRRREDPGIFGDIRPSPRIPCVDLLPLPLPSSPLHHLPFSFLAPCKSSPSHIPQMPPPSPRVQCSPGRRPNASPSAGKSHSHSTLFAEDCKEWSTFPGFPTSSSDAHVRHESALIESPPAHHRSSKEFTHTLPLPHSAGVLPKLGTSGGPPLKRKRPPKLEIPLGECQTSSAGLNWVHEVDLGEDALHDMTTEGSYYAICCKKGRRETLEDTQRAVPDLNGDSQQAFFGVFDGHGGRKAADFAAEHLVDNITDAMGTSQSMAGSAMEEAVRTGYLATDAAFLEKGVSSGTCCVTAMMKDGYLVVANAGDCRAVLSKGGTAVSLTRDHRASREDEQRRIEDLGGFVVDFSGTWRVQGTLAVTRGIGDLHLKKWISAEPEVKKIRVAQDFEFLILASDGLWDKVTPQEAVNEARSALSSDRLKPEVMDLHMPQAMASSSLSRIDAEQEHEMQTSREAGNLQQSAVPRHGDFPSNSFDDVDLSVGTMDADEPNVGFPEPRLPASGPVAACKRLVDLSLSRGRDDDISVILINLAHFKRQDSE